MPTKGQFIERVPFIGGKPLNVRKDMKVLQVIQIDQAPFKDDEVGYMWVLLEGYYSEEVDD